MMALIEKKKKLRDKMKKGSQDLQREQHNVSHDQ